jgi:hypothetical protein
MQKSLFIVLLVILFHALKGVARKKGTLKGVTRKGKMSNPSSFPTWRRYRVSIQLRCICGKAS